MLKPKHKNRTITICSSYIGDILGYVKEVSHLEYKNLREQKNSTWFKNLINITVLCFVDVHALWSALLRCSLCARYFQAVVR